MQGKAGIPLCACLSAKRRRSGGEQCPRLLEYEMISNHRIHKVNHLHNTDLYFLTLVTFILGGITYVELSNDFCLPNGSKLLVPLIGIFSMCGVLYFWRLIAHSTDDGIIKLYPLLAEIEASHEMKFNIGEKTLDNFNKKNAEMQKFTIKKYFYPEYARGHQNWNWFAFWMAALSTLWFIHISNLSASCQIYCSVIILLFFILGACLICREAYKEAPQ